MMQLGWVEELGSGVLNVTKYWQDYAKGGKPQFIEGDTFKVVLPVSTHLFTGNQDSNQDSNQDGNQDGKKRGTKIIVSSNALLKKIQELIYVSANNKNRLLPDDAFFMKSRYTDEQLQKVKHLIDERNEYWLPILKECIVPKSRKEILEILHLSNQTKNFKTIILPLVDIGLLNRTLPDKPTSGNQKYLTSNNGKKIVDLLEDLKEN